MGLELWLESVFHRIRVMARVWFNVMFRVSDQVSIMDKVRVSEELLLGLKLRLWLGYF
jgi:hypothetical protein